MISPSQQMIVENFLALYDLSPDIRFGQLMANLGFLAEEFENQSLWDIEDEQLLNVIETHLAQLSKRQASHAQPLYGLSLSSERSGSVVRDSGDDPHELP